MPFDPIRTDEPLDGPAPKEKDFDGQMLFGCTQFVIQCFCIYGMAAWPHFVFADIYEVRPLAVNVGLGVLPALAQSIVGARKFGLASAVGSLGGALAFGIFLYLRMQQIHIPSGIRGVPIPEWPKEWCWLTPTAVVLIFASALFLALPKSERPWEETENSP